MDVVQASPLVGVIMRRSIVRYSVKRGVHVVMLCSLPLVAGCESQMNGMADGASQGTTRRTASGAVPVKSIDDAGSLSITMRNQDGCTFLAPEAWSVDVASQSSGIDIYNSDRTMFASYLVYPVNTAMGPYAWGYQPPMNDPNRYSRDPRLVVRALLRPAVVPHGGAADMDFTADPPENLAPYTAVTLRGSTHSALVIYTAVAGDAQNYVVPVRAAIMSNQHWPAMAGALARMALNIRCQAQFKVPSGTDVEARLGKRRDNKEEGDEVGYNPWRGSENMHDPSTKTNYIVTQDQWSATGPDGPGYYKRNGNDLIKLAPGRSQ
jgi:hypothetical protein